MAGLLEGVLPAVYSYGNTMQRKLKGLLADPAGTLGLGVIRAGEDQQQLVNLAKDAGYMPGSRSVLATPEQTALARALLAQKATDMGAGMIGATVWHGSPHKFDKFDSSKIGTGEGAQAYGHGLYLAEAREVGADYANVLASPRNRVSDRRGVYIEPSPMGGGKYMLAVNSEVGQPRGMAADATQFIYSDKEFPNLASAMKFARQKGLLARDERPRLTAINEDRKYVPISKAADVPDPEYTQFIASNPGYLYKVDLPDEKIARMLDWDKPLSQQAPEVRQALRKQGISGKSWDVQAMGDGPQGYLNDRFVFDNAFEARKKLNELRSQGYYARPYGDAMGRNKTGAEFVRDINDPAQQSERLRQMGIPGIRYLDGGSRGAGAGTSNYVVFPGEESALTILERNGSPINALVKALQGPR